MKSLTPVVLALAALAACSWRSVPPAEPAPAEPEEPTAQARMVSRNQYGGVLALEGEHAIAMVAAQAMIRTHCEDYQITQEGEEVVGQDSFSGADGAQATTAAAVEWRLHYECAQPQ
jgi:hypothetical protein